MKPAVYLETSLISYLTALPSRDLIIAANQQITQEWWQNERTNYELYASQLVIREASKGDHEAVSRRLDALADVQLLAITDEAVDLADRLVERGAPPRPAVEDALHIAIATANGMDYLATWNFKHIANATMRVNIEAVCRQAGYEPPVICSLLELIEV